MLYSREQSAIENQVVSVLWSSLDSYYWLDLYLNLNTKLFQQWQYFTIWDGSIFKCFSRITNVLSQNAELFWQKNLIKKGLFYLYLYELWAHLETSCSLRWVDILIVRTRKEKGLWTDLTHKNREPKRKTEEDVTKLSHIPTTRHSILSFFASKSFKS